VDCQGAARDARRGQERGERIIKDARERQDRLVGEEEVTKQAEPRGRDIVEDARAREREISSARGYADEILNTLEVNLFEVHRRRAAWTRATAGEDEPAEVG